MADLIGSPPPYSEVPLTTTEAPREGGGAQALERATQTEAQGLEALGRGTMDLAKPVAEAQAASDLQNQKVVIGPDGKVQVINAARSIIFGQAGEAYGNAVVAGTVVQGRAQIDSATTAIHQAHLGDPAGQEAANASFVSNIGGTGNPLIDQALKGAATESAAAHYDHNLEFTTRLNLENSSRDLQASKTALEEKLEAYAQAGMGAGNLDYDKAMDQRKAIQEQFAGNILLKKPPDQVALEDSQFAARLQGEHLVGSLKDIVANQGIAVARPQLDAIKEGTGPYANLSRQDRTRLWSEGQAWLQSVAPEQQVKIEASQQFVTTAGKNLARGYIVNADGSHTPFKPNDPQMFGALQDAIRAGDLAGQAQLRAWMLKGGVPIEALKDDGSGHLVGYPGAAAPAARPVGPPGSPAEPGAVPGSETPQPVAFTPGSLATGGPDAGQYQPAINAAAQKYGVDANVLTRQLYQENKFQPTGTSPAGAQGFAQFMPGTAARYGVNVNDPQSSIEGAAHYMSDLIKRYNGNVGLALAGYNWGEANVDKMLQGSGSAPAETQAYVRTITGHSIDEWRKDPHLAIRAPAGGGSANGRPDFSEADYRANPFLRSAMIQGYAEDKEEKFSYLSEKGRMVGVLNRAGLEAPAEVYAMIRQGYESHPDDPRFENLWAEVAGGALGREAATGGYGGGGPPAGGARVNEASQISSTPGGAPSQRQAIEKAISDMAAGPDLMQREIAAYAQKMEGELDRFAKENPFQAAANMKIIPRAPPAIDPTNLQSIRDGASERLADARAMSVWKGEAVSLFDQREAPVVKQALANASVDDQLATLVPLARDLPDNIRDATFNAIGQDKDGKILAVAGNLTAVGNDQAARDLLTGQKLLIQNKDLAPKAADEAKAIYTSLPTAAFPDMGLRDSVQASARTLYAKYTADAGGPGEFDQARWDKAINTVTGGAIDWRGSKIIVPTYGMDYTAMQAKMQSLTDKDLANTRLNNGQPLTASMLQPSWFSGSNAFRLQSVNDGKYYIFSGADDARQVVRDSKGAPFVLDLREKSTQPPAPPPPVPAPGT